MFSNTPQGTQRSRNSANGTDVSSSRQSRQSGRYGNSIPLEKTSDLDYVTTRISAEIETPKNDMFGVPGSFLNYRGTPQHEETNGMGLNDTYRKPESILSSKYSIAK